MLARRPRAAGRPAALSPALRTHTHTYARTHTPADGNAAQAFKRAAECFKVTKDVTEVTGCYREAAMCCVAAKDTAQATALIENECLPRLVDAGRMSQAAKLHEEVAKLFEDGLELESAIDHYGKAADLFAAENSASTASKSRVNVARLCAMTEPPDFVRASEVFAEAGTEAMGSNLLKFQAKELFQKAVLCTLAHGDVVAAEQQFDKFKDVDYTLECACGGWGARGAPARAVRACTHPHPPTRQHPHTHPASNPPPPPLIPQRPGKGSSSRTSSPRSRTRTARASATRCTTTTKFQSWTPGKPPCC